MHGLNHEKLLHAAVGVNVEVPETPVRKPAVPQLEGEGGGGEGEGGGGEGGGGEAPHHVRIIEMSGAGVLGRPPPSRTPSSCAGLRAVSHTSRSFIWPVNIGSTDQALLPT